LVLKVTKKSGKQIVCPLKECGHTEDASAEIIASLGEMALTDPSPAATSENS
jgi:hypothetical protein